jgi:hypothetical protein
MFLLPLFLLLYVLFEWRKHMAIEDTLTSIEATLAALPAAVVAALPSSSAPDFTPVLNAISAAQTALATGEGLTQTHLDAIDSEVKNIQATLGPVPGS